jgi:citrate lyase subunit beta/citryl-CoA lyase
MAPSEAQIDQASQIILAAQAANWAPISHAGQLHDRASYRFFWQLIERAHQTGCHLPAPMQALFDVATLNAEISLS